MARSISVRMYNVGFGDAFLVAIPEAEGVRRILFDCGSIAAPQGRAMSDVVERIVRDVTGADGVPRIDVVVATHRHKDHVSGFDAAVWANVQVSEVWLPWTEDPEDPAAREIRDIQSRLTLALDAAFKARPAAENAADVAQAAIVSNALTNDRAMRTLHAGFAGNPTRRFLPTLDPAERTFTTAALPGVTVHVLGPSRDKEVIRDMTPPKGESYLRLKAAAVEAGNGKPKPPFTARFIVPAAPLPFPEEEKGKIRSAGSFADLDIAVALDQAVNGTSLMLVLEFAGTYLLFPGDAQWGTWASVLKDPRWVDLLRKVEFYKIGHHGSHNATPKDFVEGILRENVWAMASTIERPQWARIPKPELLEALEQKHAHLARSDKDGSAPTADGGFQVEPGVVVEARIPIG